MFSFDYRRVLDTFADAIIAADDQNNVTYINGAAERLLGWSASELVGQSLSLIIPGRMREAHRQGMQRFSATHQPKLLGRAISLPVLRRDGTELMVELTLSALPVEGGDLFVAAIRDVSERVELERQLQQTRYLKASTQGAAKLGSQSRESLFDVVVDTFVTGFGSSLTRVWSFDPNKNALKLWDGGGPLDEEVKPARRSLDRDLDPGVVAAVARSQQPLISNTLVGDLRFDQKWVAREKVVACASFPLLVGPELAAVLVAYFQHPLSEELSEVLSTFVSLVASALNDLNMIVREHRARLQAEEAQREAQQMAQFREELIGIVGHDLRNPLSVIISSASLLLRRASLGDRDLKMVSLISNSGSRMLRMIRDLLDFTRSRTGAGLPIAPQRTQLNALCKSVLEELQVVSPHQPLVFKESGICEGLWDPDRLSQVLSNLTDNALHYCLDGSAITLSVKDLGEAAELSVHNENDGAPIPVEVLPRIFEPYRRGSSSATRAPSGLGLGLYIVQQIVLAHGGTITVSSTQAEGTLFRIQLPKSAPVS